MSDLGKEFEKAALDVKTITGRPDTPTQLKLYALFKQGCTGDIRVPRPQGFDPVGNAKYNAWAELKGLDPDEAKRQYIELVNRLMDG